MANDGVGAILIWWVALVVLIGAVSILGYQVRSPALGVFAFSAVGVVALLATTVTIRWCLAGRHRAWHPGKIVVWWLSILALLATILLLDVDDDLAAFWLLTAAVPGVVVSTVMTWTYLSARE